MKNDKKLLIALLIFVICVCSLLVVQNNTLKQKCTVSFSTTASQENFCENTYIDDITPSAKQKPEFPCDINLISRETLMEIDGIGTVTAEKILIYRDSINGFKNLEQLLNIDGIGTATYEKLKTYLYVNSAIPEKIEKVAKTNKVTTITTTCTTPKTTTVKETEPIIIEQLIEYPININTAPQKLLMELPGIGEVKSAAIIGFRNTYGYFNHSDEIMNVKGIGQSTYDKIKNLITTGTYQSDIPSSPKKEEDIIVEPIFPPQEDEVIITPVKPEKTEETTTTQDETQITILININKATKEELMAGLPLSEEEAQVIVTHREKVGHDFTSKDELLLLLSKATYNSIYYLITL